ncbi:hypothetical protein [Myxococcus phage Mx1]|nr:hypothetical protein [Myxococcus phage Mx1]
MAKKNSTGPELLKELQGISDEVKRISDEAEARRKRMAKDASEQAEKEAMAKRDVVLAKLPELAREAARAGKRVVVVYEHNGDEMNHDGAGMKSWPVGAAKLIQDACMDLGFKTGWRYGGRMGYYIEISW